MDRRSNQTHQVTMFSRIVFSGGAVPALSFFGCLQYLEHVGLLPGIHTFVGSSAGAMVGFMTVLGYSPREACDFFMRMGVEAHTINELDIFDAMFGPQTFLDTLGFDDGSRWLAFLGDALEAKRGIRDISFRELANATGKVFVVCVTNLTLVRREYLSVDTTPDLSVLLAVRMSTSVPILYVPVLQDGSLYVDGSMLDNCPIASSACSKGGPPTTLALYIQDEVATHSGREAEAQHILPNALQYVSMLLGAVFTHAQSNNGNTSSAGSESHITRVDVAVPSTSSLTCGFDVRSCTFILYPERLEDLVARGYAAARARIEPLIRSATDEGLR